jgi:glutamyl-tRNA synthetase
MGVLNYIVRFGWSSGDQEIFGREELIRLFGWDRVNKSDGKFDDKKFADVAFEHLKRNDLTPLPEYVRMVRPFLADRGLADVDAGLLERAVPGIRERARTLKDAAFDLDFYFREPPELDPKAREKLLDAAGAALIVELAAALDGVTAWDLSSLEAATRAFSEEKGRQMKDVAQPARVALTGRGQSPPLFEVMVVLGRERSLERLRRSPTLVPS